MSGKLAVPVSNNQDQHMNMKAKTNDVDKNDQLYNNGNSYNVVNK